MSKSAKKPAAKRKAAPKAKAKAHEAVKAMIRRKAVDEIARGGTETARKRTARLLVQDDARLDRAARRAIGGGIPDLNDAELGQTDGSQILADWNAPPSRDWPGELAMGGFDLMG